MTSYDASVVFTRRCLSSWFFVAEWQTRISPIDRPIKFIIIFNRKIRLVVLSSSKLFTVTTHTHHIARPGGWIFHQPVKNRQVRRRQKRREEKIRHFSVFLDLWLVDSQYFVLDHDTTTRNRKTSKTDPHNQALCYYDHTTEPPQPTTTTSTEPPNLCFFRGFVCVCVAVVFLSQIDEIN